MEALQRVVLKEEFQAQTDATERNGFIWGSLKEDVMYIDRLGNCKVHTVELLWVNLHTGPDL